PLIEPALGERGQPALVAVDQFLPRGLVAAPDASHQQSVGLGRRRHGKESGHRTQNTRAGDQFAVSPPAAHFQLSQSCTTSGGAIGLTGTSTIGTKSMPATSPFSSRTSENLRVPRSQCAA